MGALQLDGIVSGPVKLVIHSRKYKVNDGIIKSLTVYCISYFCTKCTYVSSLVAYIVRLYWQ